MIFRGWSSGAMRAHGASIAPYALLIASAIFANSQRLGKRMFNVKVSGPVLIGRLNISIPSTREWLEIHETKQCGEA
jgi:hypothetical protein